MPCSTGEEPYSIAIQILENWAPRRRLDIEILASDIDSRVLNDARRGLYGDRSLQRLSRGRSGGILQAASSGRQFQIHDDLAELHRFLPSQHHRSAIHANRYRAYGRDLLSQPADLFRRSFRRSAVESTVRLPVPGGYICLGHSESMSRISSLFQPRKFGDTIIYQKPSNENRWRGRPRSGSSSSKTASRCGCFTATFWSRAGFEVEEAVNGVEGSNGPCSARST